MGNCMTYQEREHLFLLSCSNGDINTVTEMLDKGVDSNCLDLLYRTSLQRAIIKGHTQVAELLLQRGVDTTGALIDASNNNQIRIVELLLRKGVDKNQTDYMGKTALMIASQNNYIEIVRYLLNNNVNTTLQDNDGQTALLYAYIMKNNQIVELMFNKSTVHPTDLIAAARYGYTDLVSRLLDKGVAVNEVDKWGKTACYYSLKNKHDDTTKLLFDSDYRMPDCMLDHEMAGLIKQYHQRQADIQAAKQMMHQLANPPPPPSYSTVTPFTEKQPVDV